MGNGVSRVVGCFVPGIHDHEKLPVYFSEPLDEGLGHSFCYVRPVLDSPHASPPHSDRFLSVSLPLDSSDTSNGSFQLNQENAEDSHKLKILSETSFKSISGASVSANTSTPRTIASREQFSSFANILDDRAAAFESTSSFSALPLQPVPRGLSQSGPITGSQFGQASGPLDRGFLSGPLERGFMSGPIERGFLSGPLERGCMSGPIEATDRSIFSALLLQARNETSTNEQLKRSYTVNSYQKRTYLLDHLEVIGGSSNQDSLEVTSQEVPAGVSCRKVEPALVSKQTKSHYLHASEGSIDHDQPSEPVRATRGGASSTESSSCLARQC